MEDKIHRKQKRKQAQYLKQEPDTDVTFQEEPSAHLFIGNGGLKNGVSKEILEHILNSTNLSQLYLPSGKDYAFAIFPRVSDASKVLLSLNGVCIQDVCKDNERVMSSLPPAVLSGPPVHLYFSYVNKIPQNIKCIAMDANEFPPGLHLLQEFITVHEEDQLLKFFTFSGDDVSEFKKHLVGKASTLIFSYRQVSIMNILMRNWQLECLRAIQIITPRLKQP